MAEPLGLPAAVETLPEAITWWAHQTPEAPALRALDRADVTYAELDRRVRAGVSCLRSVGIAQGDRVALVLEDDVDSTVALLAVMCGAVAAPLSPLFSPPELIRDLGRLRARAVVVGADAALPDAAVALGLPVIPAERLLAPAAAGGVTPPPRSGDVMLIAHTSGTSALPKRVPITHRMQLAAARARNRRRGIGPDDAGLLLAPGSTVMFLTNFVTMLVAGGATIRVTPLEPERCLLANATLRPTWMLASPALYNAMLQRAPTTGVSLVHPRLRLVNWGGGGMDSALAERLACDFGVPCDSNYGMSEASAIAMPAAPGTGRPGAVGAVTTGELRVVDDDGRTVPDGQRGEIVVRGPHVFGGYQDDPAATAAAFLPGGWFRTGDLGYLEADGSLVLCGRAKEQINRGGMEIAPAEVEQALLSHPAVLEAAVFGVPDVVLGEDLVAAVVLRPGKTATPRALRAWMLDRLAMPKVPRQIWFVAALPRTGAGKVRRGVLVEQFRAHRDV
jgi:acyl-CoA synthetase (AMP-forming)/AMP-acid ligase II